MVFQIVFNVDTGGPNCDARWTHFPVWSLAFVKISVLSVASSLFQWLWH